MTRCRIAGSTSRIGTVSTKASTSIAWSLTRCSRASTAFPISRKKAFRSRAGETNCRPLWATLADPQGPRRMPIEVRLPAMLGGDTLTITEAVQTIAQLVGALARAQPELAARLDDTIF